MQLPKPSPRAAKLFAELTPTADGVSVKLVFGQPAGFVNGNMFFGVFGERMFVRLSEHERDEAKRISGFVPFEPMPGRAMSEYMELPPAILGNAQQARHWVARSLTYASALPIKKSKRKTR
jgi:TfoX/Sxy family transcriptional regulator of competence genes